MMKLTALLLTMMLTCFSARAQEKIQLLLQDGHANDITTMRISYDDKYLVTGSDDQVAIIWDVRSGRQLRKIEDHTNAILRVRFDDSARHVITLDGGYDILGNQVSRLIVTEVGSWQTKLIIDSIQHKPDVFSFSDRLFIVYTGGAQDDPHTDSVAVYSLQDYRQLRTLDSNGFRLTLAKLGYKEPDPGFELAIEGRTVFVKDALSRRALQHGGDSCEHDERPAFSSYYMDHAISPSMNRMVLVDYCDRLYVNDLKTGALLQSIQLKDVGRVNFSNDGEFLFVTSGNKIQLVNIRDGATVLEYKGLLSPVGSMTTEPKNRNMIVFSQDSLVRRMNIGLPGSLETIGRHRSQVTDMQFSSDGNFLATGSVDPAAIVWDYNKLEKLKSLDPRRVKATGDDIMVSGPEYYVVRNVDFLESGDVKALFITLYNKVIIWNFQTNAYSQNSIKEGFFEFEDNNVWLSKLERDSCMAILYKERQVLTLPFPHIFSHKGEKEYPNVLAGTANHEAGLIALGGKNSIDIWSYTKDGKTKKLQTLPGSNRPARSVKFSADANRLLAAFNDNRFRIYSRKGNEFLPLLDTVLSPVTSIQFPDSSQRFITSHEKGYVTYWNEDGRPAQTAYFFADGNYIVRIPGNYYMSSRSSFKGMAFGMDDNIYSAEQFDHIFNRPDKVLEYIGQTDTALVSSLRKAHLKRMQRLNISPEAVFDPVKLPQAEIMNRNAIHYQQYGPLVNLHIKASDPNNSIKSFNIWINEVPLYGAKGLAFPGHRGVLDTTIQVELTRGNNWIETSVTNSSGLESYRNPLFINNGDSSVQPSKLYFIGIGINRFREKGHELNWSVKDIRNLAVSLKEKHGKDIVIDTLFDKDVTVARVKALKKRLQTAGVNDKVIISYSGHGLLSDNYDYYLSTYGVNFKKPEDGGLPYQELESLLDGIAPRKKLMLVDACHSGEVDKEEMQKYEWYEKNKNDTGAKSSRRPVPMETQMGMRNSFELMQELFMNVGRSTGATVISAAAGTQFAQEKGELENGVFTYSILEYMKLHPHATVSELRSYVNQRVRDLTKGMQVPTTRSETRLDDWQVW